VVAKLGLKQKSDTARQPSFRHGLVWHITHREDPEKQHQGSLGTITEDYREYSELIKPLSSTFCKNELSKNASAFAYVPFGLLTTSNTACTSGAVMYGARCSTFEISSLPVALTRDLNVLSARRARCSLLHASSDRADISLWFQCPCFFASNSTPANAIGLPSRRHRRQLSITILFHVPSLHISGIPETWKCMVCACRQDDLLTARYLLICQNLILLPDLGWPGSNLKFRINQEAFMREIFS
jgi:hypothetical protein